MQYAIETDEKIITAADDLEDDSDLFIKLSENEDGISNVDEVTEVAPKSMAGLWLIGEVKRGRVRFPSLEKYYVTEGASKSIERLGSDLRVEIALKDGQSIVVHLLDDSLNVIDPKDYKKSVGNPSLFDLNIF